MMLNQICMFFLLLFSLVVCSVCAQESSPQHDSTQFRIGGIFDLSSEAGKIWGNAEKNAFILAIEDFEHQNPGIRVNSIIEDSAYSNTKSVSAFQKLSSVDQVKAVIGPTWEMFAAIMPLCESKKILCLAPSNNSKEFENPKLHFSFSAYFKETGYTDVIAEELNKRGITKSAVIATISAYHDPLVDNLQALLIHKANQVQRVLATETDFKSIIAKVPKDIEVLVLLLLNDGQLYSFLKQWTQLRPGKMQIYTDDAPIYDAQLDKIKQLGHEIFYSKQYFPREDEERWNAKYLARFKEAPGAPSSAVAYDETMILLNCLKTDQNSQKLRDCVANSNNYTGMSGEFSFAGRQFVADRSYRLYALN